MAIGENIKDARKRMNMLQSDLADNFNKHYNEYAKKKNLPLKTIDKRTISNWENEISSPNVEYLPILCKILNTDINDLFGFVIPKDLEEKTIYKKRINLEDGNFAEISTQKKWEELTEEEQKEIMDSVIEESIKIKRESNKKES